MKGLLIFTILSLWLGSAIAENNLIEGPWSDDQEYFTPEKGYLAIDGGINVGTKFTVEFTYKPTSVADRWRNIFRVTMSNKGCCSLNDKKILYSI